MPDLTTHLYFSIKLYNRNLFEINKNDFLLGVIAPDCILTGDFIKKSHFLNNEDKIDTETLKNLQRKLSNVESNYSFYFGYLTHLYLDYYFDKYSKIIFLLNIKSNESKINLLRKIKNYNMQQNIYFLRDYEEHPANLRYEYVHQAANRLKELKSLGNNCDISDDFEELCDYVSLIDRATSEFVKEDFIKQNA